MKKPKPIPESKRRHMKNYRGEEEGGPEIMGMKKIIIGGLDSNNNNDDDDDEENVLDHDDVIYDTDEDEEDDDEDDNDPRRRRRRADFEEEEEEIVGGADILSKLLGGDPKAGGGGGGGFLDLDSLLRGNVGKGKPIKHIQKFTLHVPGKKIEAASLPFQQPPVQGSSSLSQLPPSSSSNVPTIGDMKNKSEKLRQDCIGTIRKLCKQGSITQQEKTTLLSDIVTCSSKGDYSTVEVAHELLCQDSNDDDSEKDFCDQCKVIAASLISDKK